MKRFHQSRLLLPTIGGLSFIFLLAAAAFAAGPTTVQGPGHDPECFKAWGKDTKYFQWKKKNGPYRVALDNGFIGNTWRIQMIKTAKAFAEQPGVKGNLKEFKVISTGEDLPAQIAAANNFIDAGYDAVIVNALNPAAFAPVAKRAKAAGVVLLSFDNVIESDDNIVVNVDQVDLGRLAAKWLLKEIKADGGKLLEVRGPSGNSVDRDRHDGFHEVLKKSPKKFEVVEVVGSGLEAIQAYGRHHPDVVLMDWMLPGIEPTGRAVEIPTVAIVQFQEDKLVHEHIYWDQASVLVQLGLLDPDGLPIAGAETARKVLDVSLPSNTLMTPSQATG